jgi:hypothetical protein
VNPPTTPVPFEVTIPDAAATIARLAGWPRGRGLVAHVTPEGYLPAAPAIFLMARSATGLIPAVPAPFTGTAAYSFDAAAVTATPTGALTVFSVAG